MGILPIPRCHKAPPNPPRRGGLKKAQEGLVRLNRRPTTPLPTLPVAEGLKRSKKA